MARFVAGHSIMRMRQSLNQFETAFEQQKALEQRRREQLRHRAANRSRERRVSRSQQQGKVRLDRKSTRLNSSHSDRSRMPSSA